MRVIPVLDLRGGVVVHAQGGDRAAYRPIETPLLPGVCAPAAIVSAFLDVHPFDVIYIADLDGIERRGRNHDTICDLRLAFPAVTFWVDDGSATPAQVAAMARMPNVRPVVGSETLAAPADLEKIRAAGTPEPVLSLDFNGATLLGPAGLLDHPGHWPHTVVAMTLAAVGADRGPDLARVRDLKACAPRCDIYAAGGVRGLADLAALRAAGAAGVLVASALHAGKIKAGDLDEIAGF